MLDNDLLVLLFEKLGFLGLAVIVIYFLISKAPSVLDLIHTNSKRKIAKINDALNDKNLEEDLKFIMFEQLNKLYFGSVTGVMVSRKKRGEFVAILKEYDSNFDVKELYLFRDVYEYNSTTKRVNLIHTKDIHLKEIKIEIGFLFLFLAVVVCSFIILAGFESYAFVLLTLLSCIFILFIIHINLLQLNFIKKFDD